MSCCTLDKEKPSACSSEAPVPVDPTIRLTTTRVSCADLWEHVQARFSWKRMSHGITPGVYVLDDSGRYDPSKGVLPPKDTPILVTANYALSFDSLRSCIPASAQPVYILVIDTKAINVWCAAGKGTFGTDELCKRIVMHDLQSLVRHRLLILPQLGATGVSAREVRERTGFTVEWGPVRAADLPVYLSKSPRRKTNEMRRVEFPIKDRAVLIPVEVLSNLKYKAIITFFALLFGGLFSAVGFLLAVFYGTILFPLCLPLLPTRHFTTKGLILGVICTLSHLFVWHKLGWDWADTTFSLITGIFTLIAMPILISLWALNFSGCTTFSSKSETLKETLWWLWFVPTISSRASKFYKTEPTLAIDTNKCVGCHICQDVCPHDVISVVNGKATISRLNDCMECGACAMNCPTKAVTVESGVGCAWAIIMSAINGRETVGCGCGDGCCSSN
ncbi:carbon monoxide dehydrogenase [Pelomyxa schiedti]|nr:carbon monoxide dehydrogenase [Pelomyxa schiedti]